MEDPVCDSDIHRHCFTCIKVWKCTVRPKTGESCVVISCPQSCGSRYHSCKHSEHSLLCPNEKELCINAEYGCPAVLQRKFRAKHLETCPASIIMCSAEWNRWPLNSKERKTNIPFSQVNPKLCDMQLDVALALRDQRMVNYWTKLPTRIQKSLRSDITPRHPALPLLTSKWGKTSNARAGSEQPRSKTVTPRQSVERSEASVSSTDDESPWGRRKKPPGLLKSVFSELYECGPPEDSDEDTDVSSELEGDDISNCKISGDDSSTVPYQLNLDISIQCLPRYKDKPKSMYTFICAHLLRRDEFPWHYLNVHSDIHGGLDGWMEHRCPLAKYGCSYSRRRLNPLTSDAQLVYCTLQESFGLDLRTEIPPETDGPSIGDLPFEVLRSIARYLDAFSLSRLSLTCKLMRDVCSSLLDNRGLVSLQWKRIQPPGGSPRWIVDNKRWFFSSAFSPVTQWVYSDTEHLSNHLMKCPFYVKSNVELPKKLRLPAFAADNDETELINGLNQRSS